MAHAYIISSSLKGPEIDLTFLSSLSYINHFDLIKQTVSETRKNYIVIEIPKWLDDVPCNGILTELNNLGYSTYKIDNLSIIIISWDKKYYGV